MAPGSSAKAPQIAAPEDWEESVGQTLRPGLQVLPFKAPVQARALFLTGPAARHGSTNADNSTR